MADPLNSNGESTDVMVLKESSSMEGRTWKGALSVRNLSMNSRQKPFASNVPMCDRKSLGTKNKYVKESKLKLTASPSKLKSPVQLFLNCDTRKINNGFAKKTKIPVIKVIKPLKENLVTEKKTFATVKSSSIALKKFPFISKDEQNKTKIVHFNNKVPNAKTSRLSSVPTLSKKVYFSCGTTNTLNRISSKLSTPTRPKLVCSTSRCCMGSTKPKAIPLNTKLSKCESNSRWETMSQVPKQLVCSYRSGATGLSCKSGTRTPISQVLRFELKLSSDAIVDLLREENVVQENESLLQDQTSDGLLVDSDENHLASIMNSPGNFSLRRESGHDFSLLEHENNLQGKFLDETTYLSMLEDTKYLSVLDETGQFSEMC